jgi:hypothetical protein
MKESAAAAGRDRRVVEDGAMVVSNRVSPDVSEEVIDDLLDEGVVGLVDYDIGPSLDPDELSKNNTTGRGSLNDLLEFSRVGGYLVAHKDGLDRIVSGRARPGSLRFERIEMSDGSEKVLKCVQLDAYAEIGEDELEGIHQISGMEGRSRHTFTDLDDEDEIEQVVAAVTMLEREGRLVYR